MMNDRARTLISIFFCTPLLAIAVVFCNFLQLVVNLRIDEAIWGYTMKSGGHFYWGVGDAVLFFSIALLSIDAIKSKRNRDHNAINLFLSIALLLFCVLELVSVRDMASVTFALITSMVFLECIIGITVIAFGPRGD